MSLLLIFVGGDYIAAPCRIYAVPLETRAFDPDISNIFEVPEEIRVFQPDPSNIFEVPEEIRVFRPNVLDIFEALIEVREFDPDRPKTFEVPMDVRMRTIIFESRILVVPEESRTLTVVCDTEGE